MEIKALSLSLVFQKFDLLCLSGSNIRISSNQKSFIEL